MLRNRLKPTSCLRRRGGPKDAYELAMDAVHGIVGRSLLPAFARTRGSADAQAPFEQVNACLHPSAQS